MSNVPYASAIGSIMYAMISTHPYVSYALSAMSRYQSDLGESHWTVVKNILKYFRRTITGTLMLASKPTKMIQSRNQNLCSH
jgi:hypothetical protein